MQERTAMAVLTVRRQAADSRNGGWQKRPIPINPRTDQAPISKKKVKERIAANWFPSHSYGTSLAIWDHTVLSAIAT